jgi:LysM repeat protein
MNKFSAAVGLLLLTIGSAANAQSLSGSRAAMIRQNSVAQQQDYTFLRNTSEVRSFVERGLLVSVRGNDSYKLDKVSFPYARPELKLFVERLGAQYKDGCGEKLVVTSLTRPLSKQPANAHELSVHPAGMAVDLRVSRKASCRRWLEGTLKSLEADHVLEATREKRPAHYHVAVFPAAYKRHVASVAGPSAVKLASAGAASGKKIAKVNGGASYASVIPTRGTQVKASGDTYVVKKGDSLWSIGRKFGVEAGVLKKANGLATTTLKPGMRLVIPGAAPSGVPAS